MNKSDRTGVVTNWFIRTAVPTGIEAVVVAGCQTAGQTTEPMRILAELARCIREGALELDDAFEVLHQAQTMAEGTQERLINRVYRMVVHVEDRDFEYAMEALCRLIETSCAATNQPIHRARETRERVMKQITLQPSL